ncbi:MAG: hypothetical protein MHM6MM_005349 [Cercozoa sp. M6MM]
MIRLVTIVIVLAITAVRAATTVYYGPSQLGAHNGPNCGASETTPCASMTAALESDRVTHAKELSDVTVRVMETSLRGGAHWDHVGVMPGTGQYMRLHILPHKPDGPAVLQCVTFGVKEERLYSFVSVTNIVFEYGSNACPEAVPQPKHMVQLPGDRLRFINIVVKGATCSRSVLSFKSGAYITMKNVEIFGANAGSAFEETFAAGIMLLSDILVRNSRFQTDMFRFENSPSIKMMNMAMHNIRVAEGFGVRLVNVNKVYVNGLEGHYIDGEGAESALLSAYVDAEDIRRRVNLTAHNIVCWHCRRQRQYDKYTGVAVRFWAHQRGNKDWDDRLRTLLSLSNVACSHSPIGSCVSSRSGRNGLCEAYGVTCANCKGHTPLLNYDCPFGGVRLFDLACTDCTAQHSHFVYASGSKDIGVLVDNLTLRRSDIKLAKLVEPELLSVVRIDYTARQANMYGKHVAPFRISNIVLDDVGSVGRVLHASVGLLENLATVTNITANGVSILPDGALVRFDNLGNKAKIAVTDINGTGIVPAYDRGTHKIVQVIEADNMRNGSASAVRIRLRDSPPTYELFDLRRCHALQILLADVETSFTHCTMHCAHIEPRNPEVTLVPLANKNHFDTFRRRNTSNTVLRNLNLSFCPGQFLLLEDSAIPLNRSFHFHMCESRKELTLRDEWDTLPVHNPMWYLVCLLGFCLVVCFMRRDASPVVLRLVRWEDYLVRHGFLHQHVEVPISELNKRCAAATNAGQAALSHENSMELPLLRLDVPEHFYAMEAAQATGFPEFEMCYPQFYEPNYRHELQRIHRPHKTKVA